MDKTVLFTLSSIHSGERWRRRTEFVHCGTRDGPIGVVDRLETRSEQISKEEQCIGERGEQKGGTGLQPEGVHQETEAGIVKP